MPNLHLEKVGAIGSLITVACCLGFVPLVTLLSAIGAAFLLNDAVLAPVLVGFLLLGAAGLVVSMRRHRRPWPLVLHVTSAVTLVLFTFATYVQLLVWAGAVGVVLAAIWDVLLKRACKPRPANGGNAEACQ